MPIPAPHQEVFFEAFCLAQRLRCAAAIFARADEDIVRLSRGTRVAGNVVFGGRPLRLLGWAESIAASAARAC